MSGLTSLALQVSGLFILLAVLAQAAIALYGTARRTVYQREQYRRTLELLDHRVEAARRDRITGAQDEPSWQGFRKFEVARKVDEGGDICSFYLVPHDARPLARFKPGQFLTCKLRVAGASKPTTRCYSLSSAAHEPHYRISIKRVSPPRDVPDAPPGLASSYFHDHVQEQDIVDIKAPSGKFFLDVSAATPIVLVGGGIGITPVLCMLEAVIAHGFQRDVWFFYGVKNSREHIMKEYLGKLGREHRRFHFHVCYSNPLAGDRAGVDYHHRERVSADLFKRVLPSSNFEFFLCGPPPMMESLVGGLKQWGVPGELVHYEAFGPASVKQAASASVQAPPADESFKVVFQKSAKELQWTRTAGSLLECAESSGIRIDAGCRAGNCGTCLTAVRSGDVGYLNEPGSVPEAGTCLVCVGIPRSDLVLDA